MGRRRRRLLIIDEFLARVERRLSGHIATRSGEIDATLATAATEAMSVLALGAGKRVRPRFVALGWLAAGGSAPSDAAVDVAAAVELLHVSALLHDDVVDGSLTRRGAATAHVREAERHRIERWAGESRRYGEGVAILAGDLASAFADELASSSRPETQAQWRAMKSEVALGQVLDHVATARRVRDADVALQVVSLKTSMYTVVRPLLLGATECDPTRASRIAPTLEAYGAGVGEAFQLRDDVLGAFGDPNDTGKPVGDDLREGKPTWLLAEATAAADVSQRAVLESVGSEIDADGVGAVQQVLVDLGVLARAEERIVRRTQEAIDVLGGSDIDSVVVQSLTEAAHSLVTRRA